ncbi:MAG: DUF3737 family protein [Muribaculaceae bacterium]|nr:DUF3737 family protein [Muribaculaceae bacterium]
MKELKDISMGGERPLFASHDLHLDNVTITAGESGIKCCSNIHADNCRFEGKYPFWHVDGFKIHNCLFTPGARAALWYSKDLEMTDTVVDAPKMFREMTSLRLERVKLTDALETFWHCSKVKLEDVEIQHGDYLFMHSRDIKIRNYRQQGNYSFQYCRNVEIHNAVIDSRDAFWETENVTVYDSSIDGEFLGWHSKNLKFVRCHISGIQPLCYAEGLVLEDCTFDPSCNLAFEDSSVKATINSPVTSIKNPREGAIAAESFGEIIFDENLRRPGNCKVTLLPKK